MPTGRLLGQLDVCARRAARLGLAAGVLVCAGGLGGGLGGCHASNERDAYYSARGGAVMPTAGDGSALVAEPVDMFETLAARYRDASEPSAVAVANSDHRN